MSECIFCKIIRREIPAYIVYEDEHSLAFLDINPVSPGHILVVPKKHYERITDMPENDLKEFMASVQKVAKIVETRLSNDYNIVVNHGPGAGQIINHVHFHIIPRYGQEKLFAWTTHKLTEEEAKKILSILNNE